MRTWPPTAPLSISPRRRASCPARPAGGAVVAVQLKGRPWQAVLGDMIEGVVVANALQPPHADRLRNELWSVVGHAAPVGKVA